jgi:hypothetical protein
MPSQEIATVAPIPPLDPRAPRLESLPSWATTLNQTCMDLRKNDAYRIGTHGRKVVILPASSMPSPTQRAFIERRVAELDLMVQPGPAKEIDATIGALIVRYATAREDDDMMRARMEGYRIVLRDFPAWAVREAYARWLKGEIGREYDASFPPPERVLHDGAKTLLMAAMGQRIGMQMILDAEGYQPLSDAEMTERRRQLETVIQNIATSVSPEDRGPGSLKRRPEAPEEQARKEQILTNPGKGILAGLREITEANHAAAE